MSRAIAIFSAACAALLACCLIAAPAFGAASDPLAVFKPVKPTGPVQQKEPPPTGYLEGPCGLAIGPGGGMYVSDYYHHAVDTFSLAASLPPPTGQNPATYTGQLANEDLLDGPCGLGVDSSGRVFVNNLHRDLTRFSPAGSGFGNPLTIDTAHPTGVAVEPVTDRVYVNDRTYIAVYEPDGSPVMEGTEPLHIGVGSLVDGYGLAVTGTGRLYASDASTNTVKVYDPAVSKTTPTGLLKGPGKGFVSLRDSAIAVDRVTGVVYVVDNLQPINTEEPEAGVYIFNSANAPLGVLKYKIYDALPPGIAVDNTGSASQGRVFVTSGNTDEAGIYIYGPGAQTNSFLSPSVGATVKVGGTGGGVVRSLSPEMSCNTECTAQPLNGSELTLTAVPDGDSSFGGWSGACSGQQETCTVTMGQAKAVGASFEADAPPDVGQPQPESVLPSTTLPLNSPANASSGTARRPARHRHHRRKHRHHRHSGRRR